MAKRIKLYQNDAEIEVWDNQEEEYVQQGWATKSSKPKKKITTKLTEEQGE